MQIVGLGRVVFWSGGSLWIGRAFAPIGIHAHHAIQIGFALSGTIQFREANEPAWRHHAAAFVPADAPHAFQAPGELVANLFCEPESALGRSLLSRFPGDRITSMPAAAVAPFAATMRRAFSGTGGDDELEQAALDTLYGLAGDPPPPAGLDPRIRRAVEVIAARLAEPLALAEVARAVGLSPGRFRHLFVAETGIAFRAFLLWTRLNRALEHGFGGRPWTEAAHATGFADQAHLTRTTRRMYGLAPTAIRQDQPAALRPLTA